MAAPFLAKHDAVEMLKTNRSADFWLGGVLVPHQVRNQQKEVQDFGFLQGGAATE